jgi:hypothetical protein
MDDGLIEGNGLSRVHRCDNCDATDLWTIKIRRIKLPEGIKPGPTLIGYHTSGDQVKPNRHLGIDCGCYAKFHRQIAHIQGRMK